MWVILLSLYMFAKATAVEIDCDSYFFDQCPQPTLFKQIPREVDVFNTLCPEIPSYIDCVRAYDMKCEEDKERYPLEKYQNRKALFAEICEEGSALNEVVTSNLKCFNETFSNTNCDKEREAFLEPYQREVPLDEFTTTHVIPERVYCLSEINFVECIASDVTRNCGIRAGLATMEYFSRSSRLDGACPLSYRETLLEDIDEFNLTNEQKLFAIAELERMKMSDAI